MDQLTPVQAVATGLSYLFRYVSTPLLTRLGILADVFTYLQVGQVVGVALSSAVLQGVLARELQKRIKGDHAAELIDQIRHTSSIVKTLDPKTREAAIAAYSTGLYWVFAANLVVACVGFLCALPLKEYPLPGSFEEEEEQRRRREEERGDGQPAA